MPKSVLGGLRRLLREPTAADWLVATSFVAAAELEVLIRHPAWAWEIRLDVAGGVFLIGLAWWRRRPLLPILLLTGSTIGIVGAGSRLMLSVPQIALPLATYSLGAYATNRALALGAALPLAMAIAIDMLLPHPPVAIWDGLTYIGVFMTAVPILGGRLVRGRSRLVSRLQQQREQLVAEREARAVQALAYERQRISLELSGIFQQTAASLSDQIARAHGLSGSAGVEAVRRVETTAREALQQLRMALERGGPLGSGGADIGLTLEMDKGDESQQARVSDLLSRIGELPQPATAAAASDPAARSPFMSLAEVAAWPWPIVLGLAIGAACMIQVALRSEGREPLWLSLIGAAAVGLPISWSRHRPLAAASGSLAAAGAMSLLLTPLPIASVEALLLSVYLPFRLGLIGNRGRAIFGVALAAVGFPTAFGLGALVVAPFLAGSWLVGWLVGERTRLARELDETNRRLSDERDLHAKQVVSQERARFGRELHDVIGHMLTVIVLQAGAARRNWLNDPERAARSLAVITEVCERGLRPSLAGLNALNATEASSADLHLRDIDSLVRLAHSAGLRVDLEVEPAAITAAAESEFAAYRIVQESLTNIMKHAPGSQAHIRIYAAEHALEIVVENGRAPGDNTSFGAIGGRGLVGMADRVAAIGGRLRWGEEPDGGFAVRATLPLHD